MCKHLQQTDVIMINVHYKRLYLLDSVSVEENFVVFNPSILHLTSNSCEIATL